MKKQSDLLNSEICLELCSLFVFYGWVFNIVNDVCSVVFWIVGIIVLLTGVYFNERK